MAEPAKPAEMCLSDEREQLCDQYAYQHVRSDRDGERTKRIWAEVPPCPAMDTDRAGDKHQVQSRLANAYALHEAAIPVLLELRRTCFERVL